MAKSFTIIASTINGAIQEFPKRVDMFCGQAQGEGMTIIRDYDVNFCIVNKTVFLIRYGGDVFGTTQFSSRLEFNQFMDNQCATCANRRCVLRYSGCYLEYNNCRLIYEY